MNATPDFGRIDPALIWAFTYALPNVSSTPITSPVDFISGPRIVSTPWKRANGKTGDFTKNCSTFSSAGRLNSLSFRPIMSFAAILASGVPVALLTKGTVREARGLTSSANRELDIHQTDDVQRAAQLDRILPDRLAQVLTQLVSRQHA